MIVVSASIVFIADSDTVEWIFTSLAIIGFIGWIKHVNRRAEEGGNWLSNKPSKFSGEEITKQQLVEKKSGLPHIIIDPSHINPSDRITDHEFDFYCEKCGSLYGDLICKNYEEKPSLIFATISMLLFSFPERAWDLRKEQEWKESFMVCNGCGNQQK